MEVLESDVRRELELFLHEQTPGASLSNIDDIILGYVVDILATLGQDDSSFDVDQFSEMMAAYIPEFASVDSAVVCEWIFQLASMQRKRTVGNDFGNAGSVITEGTSASEKIVTEATDCSTCTLQSHDRYPRDSTKVSRGERWEEACGDSPIGKTTSTGGFGEETVQAEQCEGIVQVEWEGNPCCGGSRLRYPDPGKVEFLSEMFPEASEDELHKTLCSCAGDMDTAIQLLLDRPSCPREEVIRKSRNSPPEQEVRADNQLKDFVLSRYAFVDKDEDEKQHRPCMPKDKPKKMVRYRDNRVVSTKGERFTVLTKKDVEGEDMKKTYVNLNPLRKYRFH